MSVLPMKAISPVNLSQSGVRTESLIHILFVVPDYQSSFFREIHGKNTCKT